VHVPRDFPAGRAVGAGRHHREMVSTDLERVLVTARRGGGAAWREI
jgi:hypothetical protein